MSISSKCSRGARPLSRIAATCGVLFAIAPPSSAHATEFFAEISSYGTAVGQDDGDNSYLFCQPTLETDMFGVSVVRARLQRINSRGEVVEDNVVVPGVATSARVQCFSDPEHQGANVPITSVPSIDVLGEEASAHCNFMFRHGAYPECNLLRAELDPLGKPFVYQGTACGNGVTAITTSPISQVTGQQGYSYWADPPHITDVDDDAPPWGYANATVDDGAVLGTDLGIPLFSDSKLHFVFGDTWVYTSTPPTQGGRAEVLHSTMVTADTVAPLLGQYTFGGDNAWYGTSPTDRRADQLVLPDLPDEQACTMDDGVLFSTGTGALPQGAFSITENGRNYKYLTMMSAITWKDVPGTAVIECAGGNKLRVNRGSLAVSEDDGPWQRLDEGYPDSGMWWESDSHFTSMRALQVVRGPDAGYVYFYGFQADNNMGASNSGVRLARVEAVHSSIVDKSQYEYWDGSTWQDQEAAAVDIIPASEHARDPAVAYNAYANRYLMMFLHAPPESALANRVKLFQSVTPTGPWTYVGEVSDTHWAHYAPQIHSRMMAGTRREVVFFLSDFGSYNVGSWLMSLSRDTFSHCTPDWLFY